MIPRLREREMRQEVRGLREKPILMLPPSLFALSYAYVCVVRPWVWLKVVDRTGVMKQRGPRSLAFQNIILHHGSCQPDGRCSGMGIAHSNEVKCASVMDGDAHESSLSMFMCVCGIAASPAFYCCPLVSQWRLTTQILWGVAKRKCWTAKDGVTSDRKHCKKETKTLKKRQDHEKTKQTTWFSRQVSRPWTNGVHCPVV